MYPLFKPGDLLFISPYKKKYSSVKKGDVVVFPSLDGKISVVHRIIKKFPGKMLITKGDYNLKPDDYPVRASDIIGRVVAIKRGSKKISVAGGPKGQLIGIFYYLYRKFETSFIVSFHSLYIRLAKTGYFYFLLRGKTSVIEIKKADGIEYQLLLGKRIIGKLGPKAETWEIRKPFRLFIDESSLPGLKKEKSEQCESTLLNKAPEICNAKILHKKFKLTGTQNYNILDFPEPLISYIRSLLKNEVPGKINIDIKIWHDFIKSLGSHAIMAFLYKRVAMLPENLRPPKDIVGIMQNAYLINSAKTMQKERQLAKIKKVFDEKNIPFLVLKGLATAYTAYPDPAMRMSNDIDLLVRPDFFIKARQALISAGYRCTSKNFENFNDVLCEETFIHTENPGLNCTVELHWDIQISFGKKENKIPVDDLFARSVSFSTHNYEFQTLSPLDSFINAAIHIILTHCTSIRFMWICDISHIGATLSLSDWEIFAKKGKAINAIVSIALNMAKFWTGFSVPEPYVEIFEFDPETSELPPEITNALGIQDNDPKVCMDFYFSNANSFADKVGTMARLILPSPEYMRSVADNPEKALLILYLERWSKWLKKILNT